MADEKDTQPKKEDNPKQRNPDAPAGKKSLIGSLLPWLIMVVVMIVSAGAGLAVGRLFAASKPPAPESNQQPSSPTENLNLVPEGSQKSWFYSLEPALANLDEPSVTRYIRVTLILEISGQVKESEGTAFINEKKPLLTNWLTIYLSGLTIDDIRGDKNLRRIQAQILDTFNQQLFPNAKPMIKSILFKDFAVQ